MHLSGELFKQMAGVDMTQCVGSAPAVTDLVSGQLPVGFVDLVSALPQIRRRVKGLAVASGSARSPRPTSRRSPSRACRATTRSAGSGSWRLRSTPRDIVAKLNAETVRIMALPEVRDRALATGAEPATGTPKSSRFIAVEIPKWERVVKASGAKAN
jgi:tripartite-type tricarboxylate transporter receptor subunit TctC